MRSILTLGKPKKKITVTPTYYVDDDIDQSTRATILQTLKTLKLTASITSYRKKGTYSWSSPYDPIGTIDIEDISTIEVPDNLYNNIQIKTVFPKSLLNQQPYLTYYQANAYCLGCSYVCGSEMSGDTPKTLTYSTNTNLFKGFDLSDIKPDIYVQALIKLNCPSTLTINGGYNNDNTLHVAGTSVGFSYNTDGYKVTATINNKLSYPIYGYYICDSYEIFKTDGSSIGSSWDSNYFNGTINTGDILSTLGNVTNGTLTITTSSATPFLVATFIIITSSGNRGVDKIVCNTTGKTLYDYNTSGRTPEGINVLIESSTSFTITHSSWGVNEAAGYDFGYEYKDTSGNWKWVTVNNKTAFTINPSIAPGQYLGVY